MSRILSSAVAFLCISSWAPAQQIQPGDVSISPDPSGLVQSMQVRPAEIYELFVVVADPPGGIAAFELAVSGFSGNDFILTNELLIDGTDTATSPTDYIVELDGCATGSRVRLVRLQMLSVVAPPQDTIICLEAPQPSSSDDQPRYVDCNGQRHIFGLVAGQGVYPDGCLILNPRSSCATNVFGIPELLGQPGQRVVLPITADTLPSTAPIICPVVETYGLSGTLRFDPALLDLAGVRMAGGAPDWTLSIEDVAPGEVQIVARDAGVDDGSGVNALGDLQNGDLLQLEFDVLAPGTAEVTFELLECRADPGSGPCDFGPIQMIGGAITQNPVDAEATSFGAVKARFGRDD